MAIARSKLTSQGQISVPASVRRKLGVEPGSVLEWDEEDAKIIVRRAGCCSSEEIHRKVFGKRRPKARTVDELKEGLRRYVRRHYARD